MKKISRREFLKITGLGAEGLLLQQVLTACGVKSIPGAAVPPPSATAASAAAATATNAPEQVSATPSNVPDLVVVRGGEPEPMIRKALEAFGGMGAFVLAGANVIIKPNICVSYQTYEYAATTNPWLIGALVTLCLEAGASRVRVMDYPFSGSAESAYKTCGIQEQVEAAGGQMEIMTQLKYAPTAIPKGVWLETAHVYQDALNADVLINVPIAKQHDNTRLSLGMKNLMGLVTDNDRNTMHGNIHRTIADLASLIRPTLNVVDAVRILTSGGPQGGNLDAVKKLDTLIVSPDIVAADSYATSLFGLTPEDIDYVRIGVEMGLGRSDLQNLKIQEISLNA
jgi:uncharacterized protein (DUF362 family)